MSDVIERFLLATKKYERQRRRTWKVSFLLYLFSLGFCGFFSLRYFPYVVSSIISLKLYGLAVFCASALAALILSILYILFSYDGAYADPESVSERISKALPLFRQYHYVLAAEIALSPLLARASIGYRCQPPDFITTCELLVVGGCFAVLYLLYVRYGLSSPENLAIYTLAFFMGATRDMFKKDFVLRRYYRLYVAGFAGVPAIGIFLAVPLFRSCEQAAALARDVEWNLRLLSTSRNLWEQLLIARYLYEIHRIYVWLTHFWVIITIILLLHAVILYKMDQCLFKR